jgi:hypothetical protein
MQKQLIDIAKNWIEIYNKNLAKFMSYNSKDGELQKDEVLFVDLITNAGVFIEKSKLRLDGDFNGDVGTEVDPSNFVYDTNEFLPFYKVVRSVWDGVVIEIQPKIWILIPRDMIYEQK